jgi:hypothetical protein
MVEILSLGFAGNGLVREMDFPEQGSFDFSD